MTDPSALAGVLEALPRSRVLVVGDVMLDRFVSGTVERISPEAPVPVLRLEREDFRLGGAANVAANVAALGGEHAELAGDAGQNQDCGVDAGEWNIEQLRFCGPHLRVHCSEREIHGEQGREEHELAREPHDRSDRDHVRPIGRSMAVGRGNRGCVRHGESLSCPPRLSLAGRHDFRAIFATLAPGLE